MNNKNILIVGAGIAGICLAYWLKRYGFNPTLVERSEALRTGGYKVDIRGAALEVVKRMNIHAKVVASKTDMQGATVVDRSGNKLTEMSGDAFGLREEEDLEIMRGDLCQILLDELKDIEILYNDSINSLIDKSDGIHVSFEKNIPRLFELVIGADGLHSKVRKLAFGNKSIFAHELGMYISIFTLPNFLNLDRWEIEYTEHQKLVNLYSSKGDAFAKAAFLFVSKPLNYNQSDFEQQKIILKNAYSDLGWEVPRLLDYMKEAKDFYFDSVTQIKMDHWSKGRVALVGDAGYCASPVSGQGTSLALVGAYVLAGELAAVSGNYKIAFDLYEKQLRHFVLKNQKLGQIFANSMIEEGGSWLNRLIMKIIPGHWINFLTLRSVNRVCQAADAITLKNYP